MTRRKTLKLIENLANTLSKEKGMEDAASIMYILTGTIALDSEDALKSLCMYNVVWADRALKAVQSQQKDGGTPPPEIIPPEDESDRWANDGGKP